VFNCHGRSQLFLCEEIIIPGKVNLIQSEYHSGQVNTILCELKDHIVWICRCAQNDCFFAAALFDIKNPSTAMLMKCESILVSLQKFRRYLYRIFVK
jgi:hypothetical protein